MAVEFYKTLENNPVKIQSFATKKAEEYIENLPNSKEKATQEQVTNISNDISFILEPAVDKTRKKGLQELIKSSVVQCADDKNLKLTFKEKLHSAFEKVKAYVSNKALSKPTKAQEFMQHNEGLMKKIATSLKESTGIQKSTPVSKKSKSSEKSR